MPKGAITSAVRQGPPSYQEDFHLFMPIQNPHFEGWLLAVLDGHGGHTVAELCTQEIKPIFSLKNPDRSEEALQKLVAALNSRTSHFRGVGSTLSVACILESHKKVSIAIIGDSPVVVLDKKGELHISSEHNVRSNEAERKAAEQRGGVYVQGYLYTRGGDHGLRMSRAIGDAHLGNVLSRQPDIYTISSPQWVLVSSDGLFDSGHRDTRRLLEEIKQYATQGLTADDLMQWAERRGLRDNATAIVWNSR